ncbi:phage tail protein [uncultured Lactococcus sp.]|uniref:phage tail tube protein n=1 Tax=uncultured Lactococcus sp. TaxID=167973 RepID=UPI00259515B2|nr:phage tail protein [uncultured Lactococcus sp.]
MAQVENVTTAKPKIDGAIYSAPKGTTLPTDAKTALDPAFKTLGYISEDGLTNSNSPKSDGIKAWGGDTVATVQTEKENTYSYTLIESLNINVLKEAYGDDNVTGTLETGITVKANSKELLEHPVVIDMTLRNGVYQRIVIEFGKVSEIGDISYTDSDAVGYEITLTALPNTNGDTALIYIVEPNAATGGGE